MIDLKNRRYKIILDQSKRSNSQPTIPTTTVMGGNRKTNIFFRLNDTENYEKQYHLENATELEVFTKLRKLKDNF